VCLESILQSSATDGSCDLHLTAPLCADTCYVFEQMAGSTFHPGVLEAQLLGCAAGSAAAVTLSAQTRGDSAAASAQGPADVSTARTVSGEPAGSASASVASISDALTSAHRSPAQSAVYSHQVRLLRARPSHACQLAHR
jgi:hypothetical protein